MLEKAVEALVVADLERLQAYYHKEKGDMFSDSGVPDYLTCIAGRMVAIETKAGNSRTLDMSQLFEGYKVARAGGVYIVAYPDYTFFEDVLENRSVKFDLSSEAELATDATELTDFDYSTFKRRWFSVNADKSSIAFIK